MSSVTANPTSATETGSGNSWSNLTNVFSSNDSRATASISTFGESKTLIASGFGFSIPGTATITGIVVNVEHRVSSGTLSATEAIRGLYKGAVQAGNVAAQNKPGSSTTDLTTTYGGSSNLWGTTWTPAEINASNFGFGIKYGDVNGGTGNVEVDHISVTVHYVTVNTQAVTTSATSTATLSPKLLANRTLSPNATAGASLATTVNLSPKLLASGWPEITVEVAFDSVPLAGTQVWTDISNWVRGFTIRRGRNHELDRIEAGSLRLRLNNRDRRFDPSYTAGPYYPDVLPMRRVRVSALWEGQTYSLFTGFVEDWPQSWRGPKDAEINLNAVDAFTYFSKYEIQSATWPSEASGARIARVLDAMSWPALERSIDTGQSNVAAFTTTSHFNALQHIQDVANSERGIFFMDGSGDAVFHDRHRRITGSYVISQLTLGDDADVEIPYVDLVVQYEASEIRNDIHVTASGGTGTPQIQSDATSISSFMRRVYNLDTLLTSDSDADDLATYLLDRFKDPKLRIASAQLSGRMSGSTMAAILSREISDKVTVVRRPPPSGDGIVQPSHVEFITHNVQKDGKSWRWLTEFAFSPAEVGTFWTLGDATAGVLGTTTHLAY